MAPRHIVAIGGSDAGLSAALRARELDPTSEPGPDPTVKCLRMQSDASPRRPDSRISLCAKAFRVMGSLTPTAPRCASIGQPSSPKRSPGPPPTSVVLRRSWLADRIMGSRKSPRGLVLDGRHRRRTSMGTPHSADRDHDQRRQHSRRNRSCAARVRRGRSRDRTSRRVTCLSDISTCLPALISVGRENW
jgi:hypothetical protein